MSEGGNGNGSGRRRPRRQPQPSGDHGGSADALAKALAAAEGAGGAPGPGAGPSRTEELLQQLIDLQRAQAEESRKKLAGGAKSERLARRRANRQTAASSVAEALGVVCALLASTMLSSLVYPPDVVYDAEVWVGLGAGAAACYAPGLEACHSWQAVYGVSASVSFVLVMVSLLMTVEVYMGRTSWLHRALVVFFTGVQCAAVTVIASAWLSYPTSLAVFSVAAMLAFILISMLLLPSVLTWMYYQLPLLGGKAQMMEKLRSEKYAGTLLANLPDSQDGVSSLDLVVYVLLDSDTPAAGATQPGLFSRLVRFSFDSWLRVLVLAEEEVGRLADPSVIPALLLVSFLGDARWAHIMLNSGADPDCELIDGTGTYFPLYVAARAEHAQVVDVLLRFDADPDKVDQNGQTALHAGAWGGNLQVVQSLLRAGCDPCAVDKGGRSPLHWAAERGHAPVVNVLLDAGADAKAVDQNGRTPLHLAAIVGQREVVRALLRRRADPNAGAIDGWTPLHAAACGGDAEVIATLIRCGGSVAVRSDSGATPLHEAAERGNKDAARVLLVRGADPGVMDNAGSTPLHAAALGGNKEVVDVLLRSGADPNKAENGWTPLHAAAVGGNRRVVEALLQAGANAVGDDGWTPLLAAAWGGSLDVVEALLGAGINPGAVDKDGRTSLHAASWGGNFQVVKVLLDAGADPRAADGDGRTPLHHAAAGGHSKTVEVLLEAGADPTARDSSGRAPVEEAEECGHTRTAELLRAAMAGKEGSAAAQARSPTAVGCLAPSGARAPIGAAAALRAGRLGAAPSLTTPGALGFAKPQHRPGSARQLQRRPAALSRQQSGGQVGVARVLALQLCAPQPPVRVRLI